MKLEEMRALKKQGMTIPPSGKLERGVSKYVALATEMQIGDSVGPLAPNRAAALAAAIKKLGFAATTRSLPDGRYVWKTF